MNTRNAPILHRDNPDKTPLTGHVKVTQQDWLNLARDVLVNEGVAEVKILGLATRMGVSRSSFYWYFKDRSDLLFALLNEWEHRNTAQIVAQCQVPSETITAALCNFFLCFVDPEKFDRGLDFAVREWSRRDTAIRARVDLADMQRIDAVAGFFQRHEYTQEESDARARILYFMQLGYHALEVREPIDLRMSRLGSYILGFSGKEAEPTAVASFLDQVSELDVT